ncbi:MULTISPECIES: type II secretion system protein GspM [unclassified Pseudomonas]|uniref:type II secretion system protein GspM n=1 Tax=unclassified Pseudomonas TaxID=196821 RepID=UPI0002709554|nr:MULTISPECIES: type II secretion system protein GspM [unclassified Pseudomonas]EJM84128.1 type II secretory pathway, component PulM [Pseudomonas sp. GM67]MBD9546868.1 type II secretion system protein M [Pseudomonas sp. PDM01]
MKAAWQRLSLREQRLLLAMGAFLLVVVAFSLIWQPTRQRLETMERQHQQQLAVSAQLQLAQPRSPPPVVSHQSLSLRVSESATEAGLEIHQMDTDNDVLRLTLSGDAKALLQWLDRTERDGVALQSLTLEKSDAVLEARVVLR